MADQGDSQDMDDEAHHDSHKRSREAFYADHDVDVTTATPGAIRGVDDDQPPAKRYRTRSSSRFDVMPKVHEDLAGDAEAGDGEDGDAIVEEKDGVEEEYGDGSVDGDSDDDDQEYPVAVPGAHRGGGMDIDVDEPDRPQPTRGDRPRLSTISFEPSTHATASMQYGIDFTDTVVVRVKKEGGDGAYTTFIVHRNLLAASSPVFDSDLAMVPEILVYPDIGGPKAFNVYLSWLYTKDRKPYLSNTAGEQATFTLLVQCLILGRKIDSVPFQDFVMDAIIDDLETLSRPSDKFLEFVVEHIYTREPAIEVLEDFCVDFLVWRCANFGTGWFDCRKFHADKQEALDRSKASKSSGGKALPPWEEDLCQYHAHDYVDDADVQRCYRELLRD